MSWATTQRGLHDREKLILLRLAYKHHVGCPLYPSLKTLSDLCDLPVSSLKRHLRSLVDRGLVTRCQRKMRNGRRASTLYILNLNCLVGIDKDP